MKRKWKIVKRTMIGLLVAALAALVFFRIGSYQSAIERYRNQVAEQDGNNIRVGLLLSRTGLTAQVETAMINAAVLAFDEINQQGGINGRQIEYVLEDYASDPEIAAQKIEKLITQDLVVATIGCYSSASREAVIPVLEKYDSLLIYPAYTEGEEENSHIIYTGAMPNQHSEMYLTWLMEQCGDRVYLLGNDYVFPVICNKRAKQIIDGQDGEIVGESYVETGSIDFQETIEEIQKCDPDFIYCNLVGDSLVAFLESYYEAGLDAAKCPIASITMDEMTLKQIGAEVAEGHYASMSYFSSIDTVENEEFVQKYREYAGENAPVTGLAEATYNSCLFLAEALKEVDDPYQTEKLTESFHGLELDAPQGHIQIDASSQGTWLYSRFAQVKNGDFSIVYESENAICPEIWPDNPG